MTFLRAWQSFAVLIAGIAVLSSCRLAAQIAGGTGQSNASEQSRIIYSHTLPNLNGTQLKTTVVEVTYGPGESSPPHSHPCAVIGYVIRGRLRSQVKGEPEIVYRAGQSFYEAPNGVHVISANASNKTPVKFLAYFVCDHDTPLIVALPETATLGAKKP